MGIQIDLKDKVIQALKLADHSYSELAEYLGMTEEELDRRLEDNTLEVRSMELISKALRIPLYSFFRDGNVEMNYDEELYYNVDIWGKKGVELRTTIRKDSEGNIAEGEMDRLKKEIREKELLLEEMKRKLGGR